MALSYSTSVKDQVANYLFSSNTYAALGSGYRQTLIDKWGASCLTELEEWSKWFGFAAAAGSAPDAWEPWYIDAIIARCEGNAHPERAAAAERRALKSMRNAIDSYSRNAISYDPASTTEAFIYHCQNNRKYVLSHCIRLEKPLFPDMATVDAAFEEVYTHIWNKAGYVFRRRPVVMTITRTAFTDATWATSGKTITKTSAFTASTVAGQAVYITDGTNAKLREYAVTSNTASVLTLVDDIGATDGSTDIDGFLVSVSFTGLEASETMDSVVVEKWFYTDSGHESDSLRWVSGDEFNVLRAADGTDVDRPRYYRNHASMGTALAWRFTPPPDTTYTLRGEVLTVHPADPSSATSTTIFDKFDPSFLPVMRRMQLDRVLTNYGRTNRELHREVEDAVDTLFPTYQSPGDGENRMGTRDVYGDLESFPGPGGYGRQLGGGI